MERDGYRLVHGARNGQLTMKEGIVLIVMILITLIFVLICFLNYE